MISGASQRDLKQEDELQVLLITSMDGILCSGDTHRDIMQCLQEHKPEIYTTLVALSEMPIRSVESPKLAAFLRGMNFKPELRGGSVLRRRFKELSEQDNLHIGIVEFTLFGKWLRKFLWNALPESKKSVIDTLFPLQHERVTRRLDQFEKIEKIRVIRPNKKNHLCVVMDGNPDYLLMALLSGRSIIAVNTRQFHKQGHLQQLEKLGVMAKLGNKPAIEAYLIEVLFDDEFLIESLLRSHQRNTPELRKTHLHTVGLALLSVIQQAPNMSDYQKKIFTSKLKNYCQKNKAMTPAFDSLSLRSTPVPMDVEEPPRGRVCSRSCFFNV